MKFFLIGSIIMNIIFVGILLYNLDLNSEGKSTNALPIAQEGEEKKLFCDVVAGFDSNDMNSNFLEKDFQEYEDDSLYILMKRLLNILDDTQAAHDWNTVRNILVEQNCDKDTMTLDDYRLCQMIKSKDQKQLADFKYLSDTQTKLIDSVFTGENMCGSDLECHRIWFIVDGVKKKQMDFPDLSGNYKPFDLYAYKQLFPETYETKLLAEFKRICSDEGE